MSAIETAVKETSTENLAKLILLKPRSQRNLRLVNTSNPKNALLLNPGKLIPLPNDSSRSHATRSTSTHRRYRTPMNPIRKDKPSFVTSENPFTFFSNVVISNNLKSTGSPFPHSRNKSCSVIRSWNGRRTARYYPPASSRESRNDGRERIIMEHMKQNTMGNPSVCLMSIQQKKLQSRANEAVKSASLKILLSNKVNISTLVSTIRGMRSSIIETRERLNKANLARLKRIDRDVFKIMPKYLSIKSTSTNYQ